MKELESIQKWYFSQCNDDWEHSHGIKIDTIDNPGWSVRIDVTNTVLDGIVFESFSYGVSDEAETGGGDWLSTKVENSQFIGYGGPQKLKEILGVFVKWSTSNA